MSSAMAGQVAIVTGASRGIGRGIAQAFLGAGATVVLTARKSEPLAAAVADLGPAASGYVSNAGNPDEIHACVEDTMARFGRVDVMVNNAATSPHQGPFVDIDLPRLDKTFAVNVRGPLVWIQECWRACMSDHGGCVINISSIGGGKVTSAQGAYGMTKAALNFLTKHMAVELAPKVRVNAIAPGLVPSSMAETLIDAPGSRMPPLARYGTPDDIAGAALYLATAPWVTGNLINVDGGAAIYDFQRGPTLPKPADWTPLIP